MNTFSTSSYGFLKYWKKSICQGLFSRATTKLLLKTFLQIVFEIYIIYGALGFLLTQKASFDMVVRIKVISFEKLQSLF